MIVIKAEVIGYCMGVRRAMELAAETARRVGTRPIYTMGPLIHNRHALDQLAGEGIVVLDESFLADGDKAGALAGRTVIIRAHGIAPALRARLEALGAVLVDASCPRVLASQRRAQTAYEAGRQVILVGDREHGEIIGIAGHAPGCTIVSTVDEARQASVRDGAVVIAQTTVKVGEYEAICAVLRGRSENLETVNSICGATEERQEALRRLAGRVGAILVVGGRNSANTTRLLATACECGKPAWLIEDENEIPADVTHYRSVGLSAGASTPDRIIAAVAARLEAL